MNNRRLTGTQLWRMPLMGIVVIAGFSAIVMLLWNWLIPEIWGLKAISFWQAAGLFILTRILFGNFWGGRPHDRQIPDFRRDNPVFEKWMEMSEEERQKFINRRRDFFRGGPFGREDFFDRKTNRTENNETAQGDK